MPRKCEKCGSDNVEKKESHMISITYDKDGNVVDRLSWGDTEIEYKCQNCGYEWGC